MQSYSIDQSQEPPVAGSPTTRPRETGTLTDRPGTPRCSVGASSQKQPGFKLKALLKAMSFFTIKV